MSKSSKLVIAIYLAAVVALVLSWCYRSTEMAWLCAGLVIGAFLPLFMRINSDERLTVEWPDKHERENLAVDGNDGQDYDNNR